MSEIITALIGASAGIAIAVIKQFFPRKKKKAFKHRLFAEVKEWKSNVDNKVFAKSHYKQRLVREVLKFQFDFSYYRAKELIEKVKSKELKLEREAVFDFFTTALRDFNHDLENRNYPKIFLEKYFSWRYESVQFMLGNIKKVLEYHPFNDDEEILFSILELLTNSIFQCYFDITKTVNAFNGDLDCELDKYYNQVAVHKKDPEGVK